MTDTEVPFMFDGEWVNRRLSNEAWLARECPEQFRDLDNPWTEYCMTVLTSESTDFTNWEWKRFRLNPHANREFRWKRERPFMDMLRTKNSQLSLETRAAVLGWMLSNMLIIVPVHRPAQQRPRYH